ncbi:MAG: hypothetical protein ACRCSK_07905, partial [Fusobacteriaceae bacterium]
MKQFLKGMMGILFDLLKLNKIRGRKARLWCFSFAMVFLISACNTGNTLIVSGDDGNGGGGVKPPVEPSEIITVDNDKVVSDGIGFAVKDSTLLLNNAKITNEIGKTTTIAISVNVGGIAANYAEINANDGVGIDLLGTSGSTFAVDSTQSKSVGYNMENGIINVLKGIGIRGGAGSVFYNKGNVYVGTDGFGIVAQNSYIENTGSIYVASGTGIKATGSQTNIINNGKITSIRNGKGIDALDGANIYVGSNGSVIAKDTSNAIYVTGASVLKNYGMISSEEGTAVKVTGGTTSFSNNGVISTTKGYGVYVVSGASASNAKDGIIIVSDAAGKGMYSQGSGTAVRNYGKIEVVAGVGMTMVDNGVAQNFGDIFVEGNGTGALLTVGGTFSNLGNIYVNSDGTAIKTSSETGKIDLINDGNIILKNTGTGTAVGLLSTSTTGSI